MQEKGLRMLRVSNIIAVTAMAIVVFCIAAIPVSAQNNMSDPIAKDAMAWRKYVDNPSGVSFDEIVAFQKSHSNWPRQSTLKRAVEKRMDADVSDDKILSWFQNNAPLTFKGVSRYIAVSTQRGQISAAQKVLREYWPEASLTRDQQRALYQKYQSYLTRDNHLARLRYLLDRGAYDNARGVAAVLGNGYAQLVAAREGLAKGRKNVNGLIAAVPSRLQKDEGLLFARLKWRRQNNLDQGAIEILRQSPSANQMYDSADWWRERHIIIRRLMERGQYKTAYQLAASHKQTENFPRIQAEWVAGFLALRYTNQPLKAFTHFETLYNNVDSPISLARGAYWAGRASEAAGQKNISDQWYKVAAQYRDVFYGQLAAEKIGVGHTWPNYQTFTPTTADKSKFNNRERVRVARWFSKANMQKESDSFLWAILEDAETQSDYALIAALTDDLGQKQISIKAAQKLQRKTGLHLTRYLYPEITKDLRNINDTEWAYIHAIIRQESRFDVDVTSPAGAKGYMQLMPATAKETAGKLGLSHRREWLTTRPDHNITLGSAYLKQMVDRFGGNYALAAAAYNAGPNRVERWLRESGDPRTGQIDFIDWAETIPIYETRNYVQRVLEATYVYRHVLNGKQKSYPYKLHTDEK